MEVTQTNACALHWLDAGACIFDAVSHNNVQALELYLRHVQKTCSIASSAIARTGDDECMWPLLKAAQEGHYECAKLLLEHGSPVDMPAEYVDRAPDLPLTTPLMWAAHRHDVRLVELLLFHGADPRRIDDVNADDENGSA